MYESLFNPTTLVISFAIYSLLLLCVVLAVKLRKAEREIKRNRGYILYLDHRLTKLEEEDKQ